MLHAIYVAHSRVAPGLAAEATARHISQLSSYKDALHDPSIEFIGLTWETAMGSNLFMTVD